MAELRGVALQRDEVCPDCTRHRGFVKGRGKTFEFWGKLRKKDQHI